MNLKIRSLCAAACLLGVSGSACKRFTSSQATVRADAPAAGGLLGPDCDGALEEAKKGGRLELLRVAEILLEVARANNDAAAIASLAEAIKLLNDPASSPAVEARLEKLLGEVVTTSKISVEQVIKDPGAAKTFSEAWQKANGTTVAESVKSAYSDALVEKGASPEQVVDDMTRLNREALATYDVAEVADRVSERGEAKFLEHMLLALPAQEQAELRLKIAEILPGKLALGLSAEDVLAEVKAMPNEVDPKVNERLADAFFRTSAQLAAGGASADALSPFLEAAGHFLAGKDAVGLEATVTGKFVEAVTALAQNDRIAPHRRYAAAAAIATANYAKDGAPVNTADLAAQTTNLRDLAAKVEKLQGTGVDAAAAVKELEAKVAEVNVKAKKIVETRAELVRPEAKKAR